MLQSLANKFSFFSQSAAAEDDSSSSEEEEEEGLSGGEVKVATNSYPQHVPEIVAKPRPGSSKLISQTFDPVVGMQVNGELRRENSTAEDDGSGRENIKTRGVITRLDESMPKGIIDRTYPFDIATFCTGNHGFKITSEVEFEAFRSKACPWWVVTSMKLIPSKKEEKVKETRRHKTCVVKVENIATDWIEVKWGDGKFQRLPKVKELLPPHPIIPGDWLRIHFEQMYEKAEQAVDLSSDETVGKIVSIEPNRQKTVVGKMTKKGNELCVDDEIYVTLKVIKDNRPIASNTMVTCVAVDSTQRVGSNVEFQWRAVEVSLSSWMHYTTDSHNRDEDGFFQDETISIRHRELYDNRGGIKIKPQQYIKFQATKVGSVVAKAITVENVSNRSITLHNIIFPHDNSICKFELELPQRDIEVIRVLAPGESYILQVICTPLQMGRTKEMGVFEFGDFKIARDFVITGLSTDEELLKSIRKPEDGHYRPSYRRIQGADQIGLLMNDNRRTRIRGPAPIRAPFFAPGRIPRYSIPNEIWEAFKEKSEELVKRHHAGALLTLDYKNYDVKFHVSLWFEEVDNDIRRRQYDLPGVRFKRGSDHYTFCAPHIQDVQPPVLLGDPIDVFDPDEPNAVKYQGFIKKMIGTDIFVEFSESFMSFYGGGLLTVRFCMGRMTYKRQHYAVDLVLKDLGEAFLFPFGFLETEVQEPRIPFYEDEDSVADEDALDNFTVNGSQTLEDNSAEQEEPEIGLFRARPEPKAKAAGKCSGGEGKSAATSNRRVPSLSSRFVSDAPTTTFLHDVKLRWFNRNLNDEQKNAVRRVLRGQARPLPYIIFGPPGTGKTVTVVEAIMQTNKLDPNSRILVTAPTNHAADVIAEQLVRSGQYHPGEFIRFNGFMRHEQGIMDSIKDYCVDGEFLDSVARHRLIVSTCATAGQFFALCLKPGHFTHVFIDEAGYCTEPESMISAVNLAIGRGGQLILAGDPKQLGPVLMSDIAQNLELNLSFLERLMNGKKGTPNIYGRNPEKFGNENCGYNPLVLTKLVKNYRAHASLLMLPSRLFYDNDLVACASVEEAYTLTQNPGICENILMSKGVPIVFHGVQGTSMRERDSPSWYNAAEVMHVVSYVRKLKSCGLQNDDIGIITPYRKQAEKLRLAMQMGFLQDDTPKVGSIEEFQGGERQVVIISTVRSLYEEKIDACVSKLGFIYNEKRFNVAITRAKSLMIIVGNPHILWKDKRWNELLRYCLELRAYRGCNLPVDLDEVAKKLYSEFKEQEEIRVVPTLPPDIPTSHYNPYDLDEDEFQEALNF